MIPIYDVITLCQAEKTSVCIDKRGVRNMFYILNYLLRYDITITVICQLFG